MAHAKLYETKKGERYWKIEVSRGRGKSNLSTRFYWPEGVCQKTAERQLAKAMAEFERACENGEIISRSDRKELERKAAAEAAKIKTVRQYTESVFMPKKEVTFSENARSSYQMFFDKHILPVIGDYALPEVSSAMLTKLLMDYQKKGYAHASCVKLYNILNGVFDMAFMDDSIPVNPMLKVKRPVPRKDEGNTNDMEKAYTEDETAHILSCLKNEPLKWQAYIMVSIDTGARKGEVCGIQWDDIDFDDCSIHLVRNLQYSSVKGVYETTLKTRQDRVVFIGEDTAALLAKLRNEQSEKCLSKWVFSIDKTPDPMHPQTPTRYFKKFGARYGVADFHPHKLRHTAASLALSHGADVVSVSGILGHAKPDTTLRMYSHSNEDAMRRASEIARNAIRSVKEA